MSELHVLALGARTPLGLSARSTAAAVRAGITRIEEQSYLADDEDEMLVGARDPRLHVATPLHERLEVMALDALAQVLRAVAADCSKLPPVRILLALPEPRVGFDQRAARELVQTLAERTAAWDFEHAWEQVGLGHAGACVGMKRALDARSSELWVVGGVDSYFDPDTLYAFQRDRRFTGPNSRGGFPPGEAAGFIALGDSRVRRQTARASLASLRGAHVAVEPKLMQRGEVTRAQGLIDAVQGACSTLSMPSEAPAMLLCDINGERHRAEEWGLLQLRMGERLRTGRYETPSSSWGDVGAASIPLFTTLACRSWSRGYATDARALLWASSESGTRGAVVLERA